MASHSITTRTVWPTANDVAATTGEGKKFLEKKTAPGLNVFSLANFVITGLRIPSSSANLNISIPVGEAWISGYHVIVGSATTVTFTASALNYVYLKLLRDGLQNVTDAQFEVNTTGTAPADSVLIAVGTASGSAITSATYDAMPDFLPNTLLAPRGCGAGSTRSFEGSVTIGANQNLSDVHYYEDFTLSAGVTLTIPAGAGRLVIIARKSITIAGTISGVGGGFYAGGALDTKGGNGTDQAGGAGGQSSGTPGGAGGDAVDFLFGSVVLQAGSGSPPPSVTNSPYLDAWLHRRGGAAGGGAGGVSGAGTGGRGGASLTLIAPVIVLASGSTINLSGAAGVNASAGGADKGGGGGGGAGDFTAVTRSYVGNGTITLSGGVGGAAWTSGGGAGASAGSSGANGVKQIILL